MLKRLIKYRFLFEELVKRDFKKKYKRTVLGMLWSLLSPLAMLLVMSLVFTQLFGRDTPHFIIYLFAGLANFNYFSDATSGGMHYLVQNSDIFSKVDVPKYMFLLSRNIQAFINYVLTLVIFFVFVAVDGLQFSWQYLLLLYPILCLMVFNIGVGLALGSMMIKFRDTEYLYNIFTQLLMYLSAIFYNVNSFAPHIQYLFYINPVFVYIRYFRKIVIEATIPALSFHLLCAFYALVMFGIGCLVYVKTNKKFLYYI